jgi:SAM-dependent MidA family methyltransferase
MTPPEMQAHLNPIFERSGGWLPFDAFMAEALYAPGLGYYANALPKLGLMPQDGSDFVTGPELSPVFGRTLARQVAQALRLCEVDTVWEFGAGTGALAAQLIGCLLSDPERRLKHYVIVELSAELRRRQQALLAPLMGRVNVTWATEWPAHLAAVVVGNEVLDAMPARLLVRRNGEWLTRGVSRAVTTASSDGPSWALTWSDRAMGEQPPVDIEGQHDYVFEWHQQAQAWVQQLAQRLDRGCILLLDYGFTEAEYYHPQRHMGTLMCHQSHRSDGNPLVAVGLKDITVHVDFTGVALAAQAQGLDVLGFTSQGRFLINCGFLDVLTSASSPEQAQALKLIHEHEMGELFKVIVLSHPRHTATVNAAGGYIGFQSFDRSHTL